MQNKFRRISSERQLRRWEEQLHSNGNRVGKLSYISKFTHDKFIAAIESGFIVHYRSKVGFTKIQEEIGNINPIFKASHSWVSTFKKSHRIVSRKIMKFVTRRTIEDSTELQNIQLMIFLETVKPLIEQFGCENVFNFDQSGFQLEIHSGRSLSNEGIKKIECIV